MHVAELDYDLPPAAIAQEPLARRDAARLLVDRGPEQPRAHCQVAQLADLLRPGDLLVRNTTRVLPARLRLRKPTGGRVEVLLLEPVSVETQPAETGTETWTALVRPDRRVPAGTSLVPDSGPVGVAAGLVVEVGERLGEGRRSVRLSGVVDVSSALHAVGEVPLPPYITTSLEDPERYQTVYAGRARSVAAPTAGLHLTGDLLARCRERGVEIADVELVIGLGTFRPITTDRVEDHHMHTERFCVPSEVLERVEATRSAGGQVVAVGTTTVRALESAARRGEVAGSTDLFITPGFEFRVVDRLLTNFHAPRSSLLALLWAFMGPRWRDLYATALEHDYRFLSFGDAVLVDRADRPGTAP